MDKIHKKEVKQSLKGREIVRCQKLIVILNENLWRFDSLISDPKIIEKLGNFYEKM